MSRRKVSYQHENTKALIEFCTQNECEVHFFNEYHARVLGPVAIVDVWTPRMKYNIYSVEGVLQRPQFRQMDYRFNPEQMSNLLDTGEL